MSLLLIMAISEKPQPVATEKETVILVFRQIIASRKHQGTIVYMSDCSGSTNKSHSLSKLLHCKLKVKAG